MAVQRSVCVVAYSAHLYVDRPTALHAETSSPSAFFSTGSGGGGGICRCGETAAPRAKQITNQERGAPAPAQSSPDGSGNRCWYVTRPSLALAGNRLHICMAWAWGMGNGPGRPPPPPLGPLPPPPLLPLAQSSRPAAHPPHRPPPPLIMPGVWAHMTTVWIHKRINGDGRTGWVYTDCPVPSAQCPTSTRTYRPPSV